MTAGDDDGTAPVRTEPRAAPGKGGRTATVRRQAASGMIEALILISISVLGAGALAVWFGGYDGGDAWDNAHCTLHVDGRNDIGGGGRSFIGVTVSNTGGETLTGFTARVGDAHTFHGTTAIEPGEKYEDTAVTPGGSLDSIGSGYAEAVATLADGSTITCDRVSVLAAGG